jgi:DNA-directed RNA polymerase specialized sigma24 family protein
LPAQHMTDAKSRPLWDRDHTQQALASARYHANRWARRGRRGRADRDDLCQDILLAIIERSGDYDPARAQWSTFASLLARHVVADRIRDETSPHRLLFVPLDLVVSNAAVALCSVTQPDAGDPEADTACRIDLERLPDDLPDLPRDTLLLLVTAHGDVAAAQRASGQSCSAFYRSVDELRMWLHAAGLDVPPTPPGKNDRPDR